MGAVSTAATADLALTGGKILTLDGCSTDSALASTARS
jgi:uncharacterized metal-binding protein